MPPTTKGPSPLLKSIQEGCKEDKRCSDSFLRNHRLLPKTADRMARLLSSTTPAGKEFPSFNTFMESLLNASLSEQDKRYLDQLPDDEHVERAFSTLFRAQYGRAAGQEGD